MFKEKIFNISLLVSFFLHLFCIFSIVLVITPSGFTFNKFPTVDFLGPILEENAFDSSYSPKSAAMLVPYKEDFAFDDEAFVRNFNYGAIQVLSDTSLSEAYFEEPFMQKQIPHFDKDIFFQGGNPNTAAQLLEKNIGPYENLKIEGFLSGREIIYKPVMPDLPAETKESQTGIFIEFEIYVSGMGIVENVNRLTTTGFPEIDLIAMKYVRRLVFKPLPEYLMNPSLARKNSEKLMQTGRVKLILTQPFLKKEMG